MIKIIARAFSQKGEDAGMIEAIETLNAFQEGCVTHSAKCLQEKSRKNKNGKREKNISSKRQSSKQLLALF